MRKKGQKNFVEKENRELKKIQKLWCGASTHEKNSENKIISFFWQQRQQKRHKWSILVRTQSQDLPQSPFPTFRLVSISSTFYEQLLRQYPCAKNLQSQTASTKVFWRKIIGAKAARKMLMKLTPTLSHYTFSISYFF